jgi:hypothetical protein
MLAENDGNVMGRVKVKVKVMVKGNGNGRGSGRDKAQIRKIEFKRLYRLD